MVYRPQCVLDLRNPGFDILAFGNITAKGLNILVFSGGCLQALLVEVEDSDPGVSLRQSQCHDTAHAACATGYQGDFSTH